MSIYLGKNKIGITKYEDLDTELTEQETLLGELETQVNGLSDKPANRLNQVLTNTITEITAEDMDGVTILDGYSFYDCKNLTSVYLPETLESIGSYAFQGCTSLNNVVIPNKMGEVGATIKTYCFYGCTALTNIEIPEGIVDIDSRAFAFTSLQEINIPSTVSSIGSFAFNGCTNLKSITLPEGIKTISANLVEGCTSLSNVQLPSTITSVSSKAFYGCTALNNVVIPASVTNFASNCFLDCTGLTTIIVMAETPPTLASTAFTNVPLEKIYIPNGTLEAYKTATNWSNFADLFVELSEV